MDNISIVILNYNDAPTTVKFVMSILKWKLKNMPHIIVVDNCSTDDSYNKLCRSFEKNSHVNVIQSNKNGGYSYGNNYGIHFALNYYKSDYIAIANPDIVVDASTFKKLIDSFSINKKIAVISCIMKNNNGNYNICTYHCPTYIDDLKTCFNSNNRSTISYENFTYIGEKCFLTEMVPGSFFIIKSSCLEEIGFLDENVFLFCEERILGKKLKSLGYYEAIREDLFFIHAHSTTIKKVYNTIQTQHLLVQSKLYYQVKYNQINYLQKLFLKCCMYSSVFVLNIKLNLRESIRNG